MDDTTQQLHVLLAPGGATRLPTLFHGSVASGSFMPKLGDYVIFGADHDGDEFYQLYALNTTTGDTRLLTDGESKNGETIYGHSGLQIAFRSTMLDRKNSDIYVLDPREPHSTRMVMKIDKGGWKLQDWAHDDAHFLASHDISSSVGYLWSINAASGETRLLTRTPDDQLCYLAARYTPNDDGLWVVENTINREDVIDWLPLVAGAPTPKIPDATHVKEIELSPDGTNLAYVAHVDDTDELHIFNTVTGTEEPATGLPTGFIDRVRWNGDGTLVGFTLARGGMPSQACSYALATHVMTPWTAPGIDLPPEPKPEKIVIRSFDDLEISGYLYRPDAAKFRGPRPLIIDIHGGPEAEYLPSYSPTLNFYLNEMGVAMLFPNVRGSSGFGANFADLDNGFRREDAVRDIGAFLDWIDTEPGLDASRVGVRGGSYGGYMSLASLYHYSNRLRCGSDSMGITDFVTFLRNTQVYRQANRRYEYGDERYPDMNRFLESVSPLNHVAEISDPVLITAGANDPRVPVSESDQMVKALRDHHNIVWYILGQDEGHHFGEAGDQRYQVAAEALFFQKFLLPEKRQTPLSTESAAAATSPASPPAPNSGMD
jgi:protease II